MRSLSLSPGMAVVKMRDKKGYTLVEIMMVCAILGLVVPIVYRLLSTFTHGAVQSSWATRALDELRFVDVNAEADLTEMVELRLARPDRIEFVLDSNRLPGYAMTPERWSRPDDDGDANAWPAPSDWWARGNDLDDDDDDGNGKLDVWMAYAFAGNTLVRETSFNEGPVQIQVLGRHIAQGSFSFYGSTKRAAGSAMDTNADGILTEEEMDSNHNGLLDTPLERRAVVYLTMDVRFDINEDGVIERTLEKNITPPLLDFRTARP